MDGFMTSSGRGAIGPKLAEARRRCRASMHPASISDATNRQRRRPPPGEIRVAALCVQLSGPPLEIIQGPEPPYEPTYIRGGAVVVSKTGARGR